MKLKVCGLRAVENIQQVIELKPDFIGFIFYEGSKRFVGNDLDLQDFSKSITSVKKVGVFVNADYHTVLQAINAYGLDLVQLHGGESPAYCACLSGHVNIIKVFQMENSFDFNSLREYENSCSYFLFDTATTNYGGSGQAFDWALLQHYKLSKPFLLSGGISPENWPLIKALQHPAMIGIDINSCFETAPGIKDIHLIKTLIHELRN